ncbi:hypothetical protein BDFB_002838 [Asbolus verrucosus]|uniref:Secreted protein n=1 Tax=Asbolus verrucosus TaxID=1661398 RepID=A0A482VQH9_ASBVE|nr:hypothetical protein BDFB_002838 [Asbolus verrucosus]
MLRLTVIVLAFLYFIGSYQTGSYPHNHLVEEDNCTVKKEIKPLPSPNILCPNPPQPNLELIYSSYEDSFPEKECAKCSLRFNEENTAVYVKCYRCQNVFKPPYLVETHKCIETEGQIAAKKKKGKK